MLTELCGEIAAAVPPGCSVALLTDRGLTGPGVVDVCRGLGWHWVGRGNVGPAQAKGVRDATGEEAALWAWVARLGRRGAAPAALVQQAWWRDGFVTVHAPAGEADPWVR